jgi:hypothetical protein
VSALALIILLLIGALVFGMFGGVGSNRGAAAIAITCILGAVALQITDMVLS